MSQIRINRTALDEVDEALRQYEELLEERRKDGVLNGQAPDTYRRYAQMFVRWLHGEFDPGARNKS